MQELDKDTILEEIEPLLVDIQDAFDIALANVEASIAKEFSGVEDGYMRSFLTRCHVKKHLYDTGYRLASVANVGIEVIYDSKYCLKILRSDHSSNVPTPQTLSRACWCSASQPRLSVDGIDPDKFWDIKNLGLKGCEIDEAVLRALSAQDDGLIHLFIDWEEIGSTGTARLAVSMPEGPWKKGDQPKLTWRSIIERNDAHVQIFVPTDEDIDFFIDDFEDDERLEVKVG